MVRHAILIPLLLILLMPVQAFAGDINASLDRSTITEGETVSLILVSQGSVDDDPDFSVLEKDFEILGQSQQSSYQFINGKGQSSKQWILKLKPRHDGIIKIPSIAFGKDLSPSLRLKVTEAVYEQETTASQDFMLRLTTDTRQSYVNAQIIVTLQLIYSRGFNNGNLSDLNIKGGGRVQTQSLGEPARYEKTINGIPYNVYEARYALFPEEAGKLTIEPIRFEAEIGPSYSSLFDPLNRQPTQRIRLQSETQQVDVLPRPQDWKSASWLPAARVTLKEEWSDLDQLSAGDPITRTITLSAAGLPASQLPELMTQAPAGLKAYPDQPSLEDSIGPEGINGERKEQVAYIPDQGGEVLFPALQVRWWNTQTRREEIAELPERRISIAGSSAKTKPPSAKKNNIEPADAVPSEPESMDVKSSPASINWMWISLALGLGWTMTALYFWRRRASKETTDQSTKPNDSTPENSHTYDLNRACREKDRHQFRLHLLNWARHQWPDKPVHGLEDIGELAGEPLKSLLSQIDAHYARDSIQAWPCDEIMKAIRHLQAGTSKTPENEDSLMPLYP